MDEVHTPSFTGTVDSVERALIIARALPHYWYRGHWTACGRLVPAMFRDEFTADLSPWDPGPLLSRERQIVHTFLRQARALATIPARDALEWLFWMRHFNIPTRLLDWSESILVALYFSVSECRQRAAMAELEDGELWVVHPAELNRVSTGNFGLPIPSEPALRALAEEPFTAPRVRTNPNASSLRPIAFEPTVSFPRMLAQSSVFTIHPSPIQRFRLEHDKPVTISELGMCVVSVGNGTLTTTDDCTDKHSITNILGGSDALARYLIPGRTKHSIYKDLVALGITETRLFNDLEALSRDIRAEVLSGIPYAVRRPPAFSDPSDRAEQATDQQTEGAQLSQECPHPGIDVATSSTNSQKTETPPSGASVGE